MDHNNFADSKRHSSLVFEYTREQQIALQQEDVEGFVALAGKRDFEMRLLGMDMVMSPGDTAVEYSEEEKGELSSILRQAAEIDCQNGRLLERLLHDARAELDDINQNRTMISAYRRALSVQGNGSLDQKV